MALERKELERAFVTLGNPSKKAWYDERLDEQEADTASRASSRPLVMGVLVAAFFHALNLALAVFSPTIQALRLHYVEFFGTFFVGGGRAFTPFGHAPEPNATPTIT